MYQYYSTRRWRKFQRYDTIGKVAVVDPVVE